MYVYGCVCAYVVLQFLAMVDDLQLDPIVLTASLEQLLLQRLVIGNPAHGLGS